MTVEPMSERDIVELAAALRSPAVFISSGGMVSPVAHAAASTIELQAAEITRLRAKVARLREALAAVLDAHEADDGHGYGKIIKAARAALGTAP